MTCENCSTQDEVRSVTRLQNRTLRNVNRLLRRRQEQIREETDRTVAALFEGSSTAENALGELWGSALFDCGPEDYDYMVEEIKKAFAFVEAHKGEQTQA